VEEESQKERRFFHLTFSIRLSRTVRIRLEQQTVGDSAVAKYVMGWGFADIDKLGVESDTVHWHIGVGEPQQSGENGRGTVRAHKTLSIFLFLTFLFSPATCPSPLSCSLHRKINLSPYQFQRRCTVSFRPRHHFEHHK